MYEFILIVNRTLSKMKSAKHNYMNFRFTIVQNLNYSV